MSLRFFVDHCVPRSVIQALRGAGYEVLLLKQYIPADSPDPLVISKAQELDAILVSLDGDFADIVAYPPQRYKGIICLQLRNHPEVIPELMEKLLAFLSDNSDPRYYEGKLFLVEAHRIRVRK